MRVRTERTPSIKPIVGTFLGAVLQGDVDTMREVANADYIQHNPFIPTGLEPFIALLPVLQEAGSGDAAIWRSFVEPAVIERILEHLGREAENVDPAHPSRAPPKGDRLV